MSGGGSRNGGGGKDDGVEMMIRCEGCGHLVPSLNLAIHQLHACRSSSTSDGDVSHSTAEIPRAAGLDVEPQPQPPQELPSWMVSRFWNSSSAAASAPPADQGDDRKMPARQRSNNCSNGIAAATRGGANSGGGILRVGDLVDLMDLDDDDDDEDGILEVHSAAAPAAAAAAASSSSNHEPETPPLQDSDYWACPTCTLHNPIIATHCNACQHYNPHHSSSNDGGGVRPPDPVRRAERLVDSPPRNSYYDASSTASPLGFLSGGALLGGVLGATNAYWHGRPLAASAVNGAVSGAVSGAVLQEVFGQQQQAAAAQHAAAHQAAVASLAAAHQATSNAAARARNPYLRSTTATTARNRNSSSSSSSNYNFGGRHRNSSRARHGPYSATTFDSNDPFLDLLLLRSDQQARHLHNHHNNMSLNIDQMSYEQLLARFGDGGENRGATETEIRQLPVSRLENPDDELPDGDCRTCHVCLEEFVCGDRRKVLPCLHGFHGPCIDKWLRANKSCPICKHKIGDNSSGGGGFGG